MGMDGRTPGRAVGEAVESVDLARWLADGSKADADSCNRFAVLWAQGERNRTKLGEAAGVSRNTAGKWATKIENEYQPGAGAGGTAASRAEIEQHLSALLRACKDPADAARVAAELNRMQGNHAPERREVLQLQAVLGEGGAELVRQRILATVGRLQERGVELPAGVAGILEGPAPDE